MLPTMPPYRPPLGPLRVIHKDDAVVFVDKPAGLLSVEGKSAGMEDCLEARLKQIVQFERRETKKVYVAKVAGRLEGSGTIDLPLIADWPRRPLQKVCHATGKSAVTYWEAEPGKDVSRVTLYPETGRSHQLRVHMAALGHPIIGDRFYNGQPAPRLMLHALQLGLTHPLTGETLSEFVAAPF